MSVIKVGDIAPNFSLPDQSGKTISLKELLGDKWVVLYFYPKDDTPGCTAESCAFRDSYDIFKEAGAEVIEVSGDSTQSHQQFAQKYNLPFTLLSDKNNQLRKVYGVPTTLFILPGRVTYVIDPKGIVQHIFNSQLDFKAHVDEALNAIKPS